MLAKIKELVKTYQDELKLCIIIISITIISFNLGKISAQNNTAKLPLMITSPEQSGKTADSELSGFTAQPTAKPIPRDPTVVASKAAGTKLYHFTWCSGAKRIAEKNKIIFSNEEAAIAAGYTLAGNCQR